MKNTFKSLGIEITDSNDGLLTTLLIINNPDGTPRWICNANSKKALFLKFYSIGKFKSMLFALMIRMVFLFRLQKLVFKTKKLYLRNNIFNKTVIDFSDINWAIFTGTVGPNNKIIAYEENNGKGKFYKVAYSPIGLSLIKNEEFIINKLGFIAPEKFVIPKCKREVNNVLELEDLSSFGGRNLVFSKTHELVLSEIYKKSKEELRIDLLPVIHATEKKLIDLERVKDKRIPIGMLKKLRKIYNTIDSRTISVAVAHGDFTPWNIYANDEKLAIYDWELAQNLIPVGFDAFHFIIQQNILVNRSSWKEISQEIKSKITPELFTKWTNESSKVDEYLQLYLLINTVSYLHIYARQLKWHEQVYWQLDTWNTAISDSLRDQQLHRPMIIADIFDYLQHREYAAIKFPNGSPENLSEYSDIDLCIKKEDLSGILKYLKQHPLSLQTHVIKKSFMASVQIFLKNKTLLSIDLVWSFKRKSITMLDANQVIENAYVNKYHLKQMELLDMVRYIGLFYGLNDTIIPSKFKAYQQILENGKVPLDEVLYCNYIDNTIRKKELVKCLSSKPENSLVNRTLSAFNYYMDTVKQLVFSKGLVITFSGVDGAGKSTVIENVKYEIEKRLRKPVKILRHRPSLLPILSAWVKGKVKAEQDAANRLPRKGTNKNFISSFLRFSYYYTDYLFGQFYVYFRYTCRGHVVLYDRYYFDFINDSKRSNIQLPKQIIKAGYHLLLKPDLNFFLYADSEVILKRKKELDAKTISVLNEEYLDLFDTLRNSKKGHYTAINNIELTDTLNLIMYDTITKVA
ncbi:MAG: hypothetical protein HRT69_04285 [Flavobacteriaceae bacterium]|nr:hypothetical protein [Flavobacteriaceae bacterium]